MTWLSQTVDQIKHGGVQVVLKKAMKALRLSGQISTWILMAPPAFLCVLLMRAARPFVLIRIGEIRSDRIGHFGVDTPIHLAQQALGDKGRRTLNLFWIQRQTCNAQWAKMARRQLPVYWWVRFLIPLNSWVPGGDAHRIRPVNGSRDIHGVIPRANQRFAFTDKENRQAISWLKAHGWDESAPFVCLLARDSKYLAKFGPAERWNYHNYRDTTIGDYVMACDRLIDRGYWFLRMGKSMHHRLPSRRAQVIDYPFVDDQDDLYDIWLSAHCRFLISTATGLDGIADAYGVPTVYVNALPLGLMKSYSHQIWVPKHLVWQDTGRFLTLREHLDHAYLSTVDYERAGIEVRDLSAGEVCDAADEMEQRLTGTWKSMDGDEERQHAFWEIYKAHPSFPNFHNWIHPQARVGAHWLRAMGPDFLR